MLLAALSLAALTCEAQFIRSIYDHAHRWRAWTERPVRSTPSTAVHERVGAERRQLYSDRCRHMARMAHWANAPWHGRRRREKMDRACRVENSFS